MPGLLIQPPGQLLFGKGMALIGITPGACYGFSNSMGSRKGARAVSCMGIAVTTVTHVSVNHDNDNGGD